MSKEKIILSFVAVLIGLLVASAAFYFYQQTKVISPQNQKTISVIASPTPTPSVLLVVDEPADEKVYFDTRTIRISGKTDPSAIIIILMENSEQVFSPTKTGDFSTTVTLDNGANLVQITALLKNGDTTTIERTVSYSPENF